MKICEIFYVMTILKKLIMIFLIVIVGQASTKAKITLVKNINSST